MFKKEFNELWANAKQKYSTKEEFVKWANDLLADYRRKHQAKKSSNILYYCSNSKKNASEKISVLPMTSNEPNLPVKLPTPAICVSPIGTEITDEGNVTTKSTSTGARKRKGEDLDCSDENSPDTPSASSSILQPVRATPAQDKLKNQISLLQMEFDLAVRRRDFLGATENETRDVTKLRREIDKCTKELRKKEQHMHLPSLQWYSEHVRESQYLLQVVKCDDRACCGDLRSSLRSILPARFVIPPYPILQSSSGLCIPKPQEHDGKTFATFLLRRSLGITPTHEGFNKLPYDLYCPSLQKDRRQLMERTCQWCGLYFCTKKKVKEHVNSCHKQPNPSSNSVEMHNVRPSRILTRRSIGRSKEILCVVRENDDTEWLDETDVDFQQSTVPTTDLQDAYPVVSVEECLANPWSEDNIH
ncbi:hypothetical protein HW555_000497 [Spodoptera exigua]|uniref:C2H2-type domain-containing protein n=1 Tax=Spodoptera exigua TaxID=7107 RepID=A0A835L8U4_SPOEX|nr:hypothetical protein HW555_000497 [Spodoptera exigua]